MEEKQTEVTADDTVKSGQENHNSDALHPKAKPLTKKVFSRKLYELLIYIYGAIAMLLTSRFLFSLLGARQIAPFVEFVYQLSTPLMIPFMNMFGIVQSGPYRIEFEVIVALVVYGLIMYGVAQLVRILFD